MVPMKHPVHGYYEIIVTIQSKLENLTDFLAVASRQMNL